MRQTYALTGKPERWVGRTDTFSQSFMYIEMESRLTFDIKIDNRPKVSVFGESIEDGKCIGGYFYAQSNNKWGEAYGGVIYKPTKSVSLYAGVGVEVDESPFRMSVASIYSSERFFFNQWYEYGGSGFWYSIKMQYIPNKRLKIGLLAKRYYGLGPNLITKIVDTPVSISLAPLYDFEFKTFRGLVLLRIVF